MDHAAIIVDRLGLHSYAHVGKIDGVGYKVNGVTFDSFENGVLVESKGPGYEKFLEKDRSGWRSWFRGGDDMTDQAVRQVRAANGTPIEWRVAEARVADKLTAQFARENLPIQVRHIKAVFS
ncbi:Tox-REase-5 domain-containing protein [Corynebacterium cystitidis]|uniref:Tox-REase-5 domain-containing protein n=1 Tax=Corynebacterium cystitidis TaxID=35757 RepID=UPI00358DBF04